MKLNVVAIGHRLPDWLDSGFNEYAKRMPRDMPLTLIELKPEVRRDEPGSSAAARVLEKEAQRIDVAWPKDAVKVERREAGEPRELGQ